MTSEKDIGKELVWQMQQRAARPATCSTSNGFKIIALGQRKSADWVSLASAATSKVNVDSQHLPQQLRHFPVPGTWLQLVQRQ